MLVDFQTFLREGTIPSEPENASLPSHASIAVLVAIFFSRSFAASLVAPCLPAMSEAFGVTYEGAGSVVSLFFLGYALTAIAAGPLMDRIGRRTLLAGGTCVLWMSTLGFAVAPDAASAALVAFFFGVAGIGDLTATVMLADLGGERRGRLLSIGHGAFALGAVIVPVLAGVALDSGIGFRTLFAGAAALNLAVFLIVSVSRMPPVEKPAVTGSLAALVRTRSFKVGIAATLLYACAEVAITIWLPTFLRDRHGASDTVAASSVTAFWTVMMAGRLGLAQFIDRMNPSRLLAVSSAAAGACAAMGLTLGEPAASYVAMVAAGLFMSSMFPLLQSLMSGRFPGATGQVLSMMGATVGVGGVVAPYAIGALADAAGAATCPGEGLSTAMWLCPAAFATLSVLMAVTASRHRP